ncbi:MAG: methyltransferase domain-containing protein [Planctomycetota bacterium]|jgi:hypothetical protein
MALVEVNIPLEPCELPEDVSEYLTEASERIEAFIEGRLDDPVAGFVPSDYPMVYAALRHIHDHSLAPGAAFCEWGSGLGVVSGLAAMLGFDVCGIEIEQDLVDQAEAFLERFDLPAQFACGSYVPESGQKMTDQADEYSWLALSGANAYDELGLEIDDFDIVFVYPWPGEEQTVRKIFKRYASQGAVLVMYLGLEEICVFRKVG